MGSDYLARTILRDGSIMDKYTNSIWQEQRRKPYYRIQTTDPAVARKLRRRTTFKLVCCGINATMWIFRGTYSTPQKAKISIERLTDQKVKKDAITGGFVTKNAPILTSEAKSQNSGSHLK